MVTVGCNRATGNIDEYKGRSDVKQVVWDGMKKLLLRRKKIRIKLEGMGKIEGKNKN